MFASVQLASSRFSSHYVIIKNSDHVQAGTASPGTSKFPANFILMSSTGSKQEKLSKKAEAN
jgi:hypothetical protein